MPTPPFSVTEVLDYLRLEDAEGLVRGSVKYVGYVEKKDDVVHYWSYPLNGRLAWAAVDRNSLGDARRVPAVIRQRTAPLAIHRIERPAAAPKHPWVGENRTADLLPKWVPLSRLGSADLEYVAAFKCDFETAAKVFNAKPFSDKYGGGAGLTRSFFLELARNRLARLDWELRAPDRIALCLTTRNGVAYWDDYDQVMNPLGVSLKNAFRQAGINWRHRKPTPEALARTRDHEKRMWMWSMPVKAFEF